MKWYKIYLNGENRIWKKCITYSWEFIYEDKEINFQRIIDSSSSERYQIKALIKGKGLIAKSISEFGQIRMPEFAEVSHLFLVREDIEYKRIVLHKRNFFKKGFSTWRFPT